jgi:SAM-dependent methyltransferase
MAMSQRSSFLAGEGDAWFSRNSPAREDASQDHVASLLTDIGGRPRSVLEIGCSNGSKLARLCAAFGCAGTGIDPSARAIEEGRARHPDLHLAVGTAESLPFPDGKFDLVIFGFCLYLCDRQDLFRIAAEADRCLSDGGMLAISDFMPPTQYRNPYCHMDGVYSYKFDCRRMFLWNPAYFERALRVYSHGGSSSLAPDDRTSTVILQKDLATAWPARPDWNSNA